MPLALAPESAAERTLALRRREDLQFCLQNWGGERYWAVKDPVALKYFHLREVEYTILMLLDGQTSLEEVRRQCERKFAPRRLGMTQLHGYLSTLHRAGLLLATSTGQGEQLLTRRGESLRKQRIEKVFSALAIRFRGVDPRWLLDGLAPKFGWLFSAWCVAATLALALGAALLVSAHFEAFQARLPDLRTILGASNLPWLVVALATTKVLHELGHALACRRSGSECHEIGVMLLVFTPCLYCNVSDSWMLENKWHRIAIAAAGIYVELILASVATFLWWYSEPGIFNALCLNTMIICSFGTLLLNGNPLLRYDGYYILSDLAEVPNLSAQSTSALRRLAARWLLGLDLPGDTAWPTRRPLLLAAYAGASAVYRWVVVCGILWALNEVAKPYHLQPLVLFVAAMTVSAMFVPPLVAGLRWARDPTARRRLAPARAGFTACVVAGVLALFCWLPLPMRVAAPLVVEYRDAQRVYVTAPGEFVSGARVGQQVTTGETLARLASPSVELEIARLRADRASQKLFLSNLEARRLQGEADGSQVPAAKAALVDVEERLEQFERDAERLTIVAPTAGTVLPPPALAKRHTADKLDRWSGLPLDERNVGTFFESGTLLCLVGDPRNFEAALHIEQNDIELVAPEQGVRLRFDSLPGQVFSGTVAEIAKLDLKVMPRELTAAGDVPARADSRGVMQPLDTWYQARVHFDANPPDLVANVHGQAKISVTPQSLGQQLVRYLKQTFGR